jgi:hypothetical protein
MSCSDKTKKKKNRNKATVLHSLATFLNLFCGLFVVFLVNRLTKGRAADAAFELILFVCLLWFDGPARQASPPTEINPPTKNGNANELVNFRL